MKTINNSPGSFFVGQNLPDEMKRTGKVEGSTLALLVAGEERPRPVTFIMGSQNKGWYLTCKGTGHLPVGEVDYELLNETARVVDEDIKVDDARH